MGYAIYFYNCSCFYKTKYENPDTTNAVFVTLSIAVSLLFCFRKFIKQIFSIGSSFPYLLYYTFTNQIAGYV